MTGDRTFWRSLEELEPGAIEDLLAAEFPALHQVARMSRRDLMRLMGASLALAGAAGCGAPSAEPVTVAGGAAAPADFVATTLELDGYGRGALVRRHQGRPVKVEGNPLHPASLGATDPFMQADLLGLYDPDRSAAPWSQGRARHWAVLRRWLSAQARAMESEAGAGTHILFGATSSPAFAALIERVRTRFPAIRFHSYSPVTDIFAPAEAVPDFATAETVLSLGADFLGPGPAQVRHARDWAGRRREERGRLIVLEPGPTLTGAQADERFALPPHEIADWARAVAVALAGGAAPPRAAAIAEALRASPSPLVVAEPDLAALAEQLNAMLGARALRRIAPVRLGVRERIEPVGELFGAMAAGEVRRLILLDCNPAYDAPAPEAFEALIARVPEALHLGLHRDETALLCRWHAPMRHALESWGDLRAYDGTPSLQQPASAPRVPALTPIELLALVAGERPAGAELVRRRWDGLGDAAWAEALRTGTLPADPPAAAPVPTAVPPPPLRRPSGNPRFTLQLIPDARLWDGRYANNAWLQELPDPLTRTTWGNAARISPADAEELGVETGDIVALRKGDTAVEMPVWVMPGQARGAITLPLGYGRPHAGRVGGGIGVSAWALRGAAGPLEVAKVPGRGRIIATEGHSPIGDARPVRIVSPGERAEQPLPESSFYPDYAYPEQAWGMVIDLDACIGCGACTIACQAENNIPVVGPDEVERGREMHWIRVDRWFEGGREDPAMHFQPVPCMHCEKAPCEPVCPVGATVHSSDGLNQMVYNRCIGTRTCSNNCPYKVRRFNWFDYQRRDPSTPAPVHNPDVLVRDRGVMEKCTYCVHRIQAARAEATVAGRPLEGDAVATACQQACPSNAIVFGDLNAPGSEVARLRRSSRNYALLGHLGTKPRTTYLARTRRDGGKA